METFSPQYLNQPELIIGIAGPIGIKIDSVIEAVTEQLRAFDYNSHIVKLTDDMTRFHSYKKIGPPANTYDEKVNYKIEFANDLRTEYELKDAMARIAIHSIRSIRLSLTKSVLKPSPRSAYIIRQLKLPEEVDLLRNTYGKSFFLISAFGDKNERLKIVFNRIKATAPTVTSDDSIHFISNKLISRDEKESNKFGQNTLDTFSVADCVIDGINESKMKKQLERFLSALFGSNSISPTLEEFGMYQAKSVSFRSIDLSRQVGAAIFDESGSIVSQGCNDVVKAGGGIYRDDDEFDNRDIKKGGDPNETQKNEIVRDILERLFQDGHIDKSKHHNTNDLYDNVTDKKSGSLTNSYVMDLTEYGRIVHAEMNAISEAARNGYSVKNTILFCTTFPCHNCMKHIIAAGIKSVVFIEPYPKSKSLMLFGDEIAFEQKGDGQKVVVKSFTGITPLRYRDIFQKSKRKSSDGKVNAWYRGKAMPMLDVPYPYYLDTTEVIALGELIAKMKDLV